MSAAEQVHEGSCLCGKVRYRVSGPIKNVSNCHCVHCRKSHGAAFATYADVERRHFKFLQGEDQLATYTADTGTKRSFCRSCGANILCFTDSDPDLVEITPATLDTRFEDRPQYHIFVRSKVPWLEIQDGRPQHAAYPEKR
jgi:hypothetical protein